jgi:hypothetical protein
MELFGVDVSTDSDTGFLSLTDLQRAYDNQKSKHNWSSKRTNYIFTNESFIKSLYHILLSKNMLEYDINTFYKLSNELGALKLTKSFDIYYTKGARKTKRVYCVDWLWRIIYHWIFNEISFMSTPKFILDIENCIDLTQSLVDRRHSREISFIEKLINSSSLITDCCEKQYRDKTYLYDLKISMLNLELIIEYHENAHKQSEIMANDYNKFLNAQKRFYYIVVPYDKEEEQLDYIKSILKNKPSINKVNEIESFRYNSIVSANYSTAINEKIFGKSSCNIRHLASSIELQKISEIEKYISGAVKENLTSKQVLQIIKDYKK